MFFSSQEAHGQTELRSEIRDLEWQLKGRLSELEQQIAELRDLCHYKRRAAGSPRKPHYFNDFNDYSDDSLEEDADCVHLTEKDLESNEGHVLEESVWDCSLFIGIPCVGTLVSLSLAVLVILNITMQALFCYNIAKKMIDDPLDPQTMTGLLRFRFNEAHNALYADQITKRSLARQVCDLDAGLHWADSQVELLKDLNGYMEVGRTLCLLAIACWLAPLLKETMDTVHFTRAIVRRLGRRTILEYDGDSIVLRGISLSRFFFISLFIVVPRMCIVVALFPIGMYYLSYTISPSELVLNAMALTFIIQIDEIFYGAFAPRRVKCLVRNLKPIPVASIIKGKGSQGVFSTVRMMCLMAGIAYGYFFMIQPFSDKVVRAKDILCNGDQDFIYSVHPSTGLVEATHTRSSPKFNWTDTQKTVFQLLANGSEKSWNVGFNVPGWPQALLFPSERKFNNSEFDSSAFDNIVRRVYDDVLQASRTLVCEDWDKLASSGGSSALAAARIKEASNRTFTTCFGIEGLCSGMAANAIRALCPITCGCSNVMNPPAGFFASPNWGCPMKCHERISASQNIEAFGGHQCQDVDPNDFMKRPLKNYVQGFQSYFLSLMESGGISVSLGIEIYQLQKELKITGMEISETAESIINGTFFTDVTSGNWRFAKGVPHPRKLVGCQFWTSWEVIMIFGTDLCSAKNFRSLRMACPVSCKCKGSERECPNTCVG